MTVCPQCGRWLGPSSSYCPTCGTLPKEEPLIFRQRRPSLYRPSPEYGTPQVWRYWNAQDKRGHVTIIYEDRTEMYPWERTDYYAEQNRRLEEEKKRTGVDYTPIDKYGEMEMARGGGAKRVHDPGACVVTEAPTYGDPVKTLTEIPLKLEDALVGVNSEECAINYYVPLEKNLRDLGRPDFADKVKEITNDERDHFRILSAMMKELGARPPAPPT